MWNSGDAHRFTSSSANSRQTRMSVSDWHMRFWWVSTAPLGRPVVPEVYMMRAGLSSGTSTAGGSAGPAPAGPAPAGPAPAGPEPAGPAPAGPDPAGKYGSAPPAWPVDTKPISCAHAARALAAAAAVASSTTSSDAPESVRM